MSGRVLGPVVRSPDRRAVARLRMEMSQYDVVSGLARRFPTAIRGPMATPTREDLEWVATQIDKRHRYYRRVAAMLGIDPDSLPQESYEASLRALIEQYAPDLAR